jgi:pyrroloquinoline quinone biosynthesis protein B
VPRSQSSLAVSSDGDRWVLLNASPDLRQQIERTHALHPRHGVRHSPIAGVVLTNGDVDHVAGLLSLREGQSFSVYETSRVLAVLEANPVFNVLRHDLVARLALVLNRPQELTAADGADLGLVVEPFAVPGKVALYLEDPAAADFGTVAEDTIGLRVSEPASGHAFFYIPGCASLPADLADRLRGADLVFFDGTAWRDDEMAASGAGEKTSARMGHMCMSGEHGSLAAFADLNVRRKIYIHINNTNPVLLADSPERARVESLGWEVAYDGMDVTP